MVSPICGLEARTFRLCLEPIMSSFRLYNRRLDAFLACARTGSFTQAAQRLYVTPTALIKQINTFEDGIGAPLFERTPRGLKLTRAGERLRLEAVALIALSDSILRDIARAASSDENEINVGTSAVFSGRYVFDCWYRHREELPGTKMRLISYGNTRAEVDRSLERLGDEIDIIAGVFDERFLTRYNCAGVVLERVPIGLSVATGDPLAEQDRIGLAELSGRKIFLPRFGMLEDFDSAQTELRARIPDARFTEFDLLDIDVFNRALTEEELILNIGCWSDVHPLFRMNELDWAVTARFGFMLPKEPNETVRRFVDVVSASFRREE